jgi:glycogen debranching enzyme
MTSVTDMALERSLDLLGRAATEHGFVASPAFDHYAVIWVRDAAISSIGALLSSKDELVAAAIASMRTMGRATTPLGQVADVARPEQGYWDWGDGGVVDATAWYVILAGAVLRSTGDVESIRDQWPHIVQAMSWLRHQDVTGTGLLSVAPATDWMDGSLTRSGRTLNINVLYQWAAKAASRIARSLGEPNPIDHDDVAERINTLFWPTSDRGPETLLKDSGVEVIPEVFPHPAMVDAHAEAASDERRHYVSHVIHADHDEHCDTLANLISICTRVADAHQSAAILDFLDDLDLARPYPTRVWDRPVTPDEPSSMYYAGVDRHLHPRWRNPPYAYHNGAVWPFVGGFHVAALALAGRSDEAAGLLVELAEANRVGQWGFHEWLDGESGEPSGAPQQTWNAGMYVLAWHAVRSAGSVHLVFG